MTLGPVDFNAEMGIHYKTFYSRNSFRTLIS